MLFESLALSHVQVLALGTSRTSEEAEKRKSRGRALSAAAGWLRLSFGRGQQVYLGLRRNSEGKPHLYVNRERVSGKFV